jgi:hypothetical protein
VIVQLLVACFPTDDVGTPPLVRGPRTQDSGEYDPGPLPDSDPTDSDEPQDTSVPIPSGQQACYLGADRTWETCLDLVDYDPAWGSDYDYPEPYQGSSQYIEPLRYVDLSAQDPDLKLAPNFVLSEFMSEAKGRYGVFQTHVVDHLQDIRDQTGGPITVNSGYRNVTYNAGVGGVSSSRHVYGDAVDMTSGVVGLSALGEICDAHGAGYVGYYDTHVHCDWRADPLDAAFYGGARAGIELPSSPLSAELVWAGRALRAPAQGWDEGQPLREWRAWSRDGRLLAEQTGASFTPPTEATRVEVVVGREVILEVELPAP